MRQVARLVTIAFLTLIWESTAVALPVSPQQHQSVVTSQTMAFENAKPDHIQLDNSESDRSECNFLARKMANVTNLRKKPNDNVGQFHKVIKNFKKQVLLVDKQIRVEFEKVTNHLRHQKLPQSILQRNAQAQAAIQKDLSTKSPTVPKSMNKKAG